ncbi:MAG TPA: FHA domain-containing protein [Ktedonobacteraceae bacterium]|jgi:pSer/pThr/pTyr-binding forkhead associated (FHA) protein|nr:FHA domain-containing protein [Ktedonobacteraceae bacterium]
MRLRHYFSEIWTVYVDEREVMPEEQFDQVSTAYLVMKNGPQIGKRVELWKNVTTIGRSRECDLFLEDLAVHRKQASILRTTEGYMLRDDHGGGDSFVNSQPVTGHLLKDGDVLSFGNTTLTFYAHEGTRPFQLPSSRGQELKKLKKPDPEASAIAKLALSDAHGSLGSYELQTPETTIGRSRECDIFLEDLAVSRLHATIRSLSDGSYEIEDHRSATGTFVNGMRITRYRLIEGDTVQIGASRLTFQYVR